MHVHLKGDIVSQAQGVAYCAEETSIDNLHQQVQCHQRINCRFKKGGLWG